MSPAAGEIISTPGISSGRSATAASKPVASYVSRSACVEKEWGRIKLQTPARAARIEAATTALFSVHRQTDVSTPRPESVFFKPAAMEKTSP